MSLQDLTVRSESGPRGVVLDETRDAPSRRALQSFCLLLLNLNEVVYID